MLPQIAWPLVVLIVVLACFAVFRKEIGGFIGRLGAVRIGRVQATAAPQSAETAVRGASADELLAALFRSPLVSQQEAPITKMLNDRGITEPRERERALTGIAAACFLAVTFDRIYISIYGSQIRALNALNAAGAAGLPVHAVRPFYDQAASASRPLYSNYPFDRWLGFLTSFELVSVTGDHAFITARGQEFLKYLVGSHFSIERPF